jgi:predicted signal transduction protein with EAL and GGDEF domain
MVAEAGAAMVARFDGGTFAILVESSPTAPDTVTMIAEINRAFAEPVRIDGHRVPTSVSIGVVHQPARDADPASLIRAADLALRRAKSRGRGQWAVFDQDRDTRDDLSLAASMPDAWDNGTLRVVYRPVVRLADEQVVAIDALLRWDHPAHGTLPHHRCQELAEHTGLILPLGTHLLRRACEQFGRRHGVPVRITLTAHQSTDRDLVANVLHTLDETGMPPARLQVAVPIRGPHADRTAADNLTALAAAGVQLAIHHVTGTPEDLACLENHPIHTARFAPSLIRHQSRSALVAQSVPHLITLIHTAGTLVTVDDLSTRLQAHSWQLAGADTATGPLFARAALA